MTPPIYDAFARVYDLQHSTHADDLPFYLALARQMPADQAVLELGCGTGRVMAPLLQAGRRITGVDESAEMLALARAHFGTNPQAELLQADARAFKSEARFGLALIALNTFLHNLTRDDQLATLRSARAHLVEGGHLAVDLPPNDELAFQPDDGVEQLEATLIDPQTHSRISKWVASRVYWATQEQELTYRIQEERDGQTQQQVVAFRLRHVFRHEMELLLLQAGFAAPRWFGDYQMHPYVDDSPRMICVARAG